MKNSNTFYKSYSFRYLSKTIGYYLIFSIIFGFLLTPAVQARPSMKWKYINDTYNPRKCWKQCQRKVLGNCVQYVKKCDYRTRTLAFFDERHKRVIRKSMNYISGAMSDRNVRSCIQKYTEWYRVIGIPKGQKGRQSNIDYNALRIVDWFPLNIKAKRATELASWSGQAYLERKAWARKKGNTYYLNWNGALNIELNVDWMDKIMSQYSGSSPRVYRAVAGTIIHEVLHQMGHGHPEGDYNQGHFVVVVGDCIESQGTWARSPKGLSLTARRRYNILNRPK